MNRGRYWKIGLFVVIGVVTAIAAIAVLGTSRIGDDQVSYTSFFDEGVTGLELGAPVRFRGVRLGAVTTIDVAQDRRHVEIAYGLSVNALTRMGLVRREGRRVQMTVPANLRVQLASTGVTGLKYIQMDFFDPKAFPPPDLPFAPPERYIPAAPSTLKNLEDSVVQAVQKFPELAEQILVVLTQISGTLAGLEQKQLPEKAAAVLVDLDRTIVAAERKLASLDTHGLSREAKGAIAAVNGVAAHLDTLLARVDGETGLLASAQRTSDAFGDMARHAGGVGPELYTTLRDMRDAIDSVRRLADALERDPDMLLKGRAKASR